MNIPFQHEYECLAEI